MRYIVFSGVLAAAALWCSACSVGPKYKQPSVATPPQFKEHPPAETDQWKTSHPNDGELRGDWWELFGDSELSSLEAMVGVSNQNVALAAAQYRQARALVGFNRSGYFPTLSTSPSASVSSRGAAAANATRTAATTGAVTGTPANTTGTSTALNTSSTASRITTFLTLPFTVSWEPNLWGRVTLAVENATANAQAGEAELENMRLSMQANLATDYFLLRGLDMQIAVVRATVAAYEQSLKLTTDRFNAGVAARTDVVTAQTQLETTQAQLTELGIARAQYEHAIAVLTGRAPAELTIAAADIRGGPPPVPAGFPSQLLERRPDIAAAERRVAAANAEIGLARVAYYPSLFLGASAGLSGSNLGSLFSWPSRFWSVGPTVDYTLLDFGARKAQVREFEALYDANVATYRQTVLTAFQEVEDSLSALRILETESGQIAAAVGSAEESVRLTQAEYSAGTATQIDVITTQTILLNNRRSAVSVLQNRMTATVQLILALGGGWNLSMLPSPASLRSSKTP
jgi:NodT family efflux transporter outer membrane factor (OMF) lipoprotein